MNLYITSFLEGVCSRHRELDQNRVITQDSDKVGRVAFSLQLSFYNNFPLSLGYIRKLAFCSPSIPIHTLVEWILGDSHVVPREIHVRPV